MIFQRILIVFVISLFVMNIGNASERFTVSEDLERQILRSPFKLKLTQGNGKKIIVYLFAEDEKAQSYESEKDGLKKGHYYLYLYDVNLASFFPYRTQVFKDFYIMEMNTEGANFFTLPKHHQNQPNVILISQFITPRGDQYEAYGISEGDIQLKRYAFSGERKNYSFTGKIKTEEPYKSGYIAYTTYDQKMFGYLLSISERKGEIKVDFLFEEHI